MAVYPYDDHRVVGNWSDNDTRDYAYLVDQGYFTRGDNANVPSPGGPTVSITGYIDGWDVENPDEALGDIDWYQFTIYPSDFYTYLNDPTGVSYVFDIDGAAAADGGGLDTVITIYDANGNQIATNDDGGSDPGSLHFHDSYLTWTPETAGDFYVTVKSYHSSTHPLTQGDYTLNIAIANPDTGTQGQGPIVYGSANGDSLDADGQDLLPSYLYGFAGDDNIYGFEQDDYIEGGDGADTVYGDLGSDEIYGDDSPVTVFLLSTTQQAYEGPGDEDILNGGAGDDRINGGRGNDQLFGGDGKDWLQGAQGNDRIEGGRGGDIYGGVILDSTDPGQNSYILRPRDSAPGDGNYDTFQFDAGGGTFKGAGVAGGDTMSFVGFGGPVFLHGLTNVDHTLGTPLAGVGNGAIDAFYTHQGGTFLILDTDDNGVVSTKDLLISFAAVLDFIASDFKSVVVLPKVGQIASETFDGTAKSDFFKAGDGNDTVRGSLGTDLLNGEGGDDRLFGGAADDSLDGGDDDDGLNGEVGNDQILGGSGRDTIAGGAGKDIMNGNAAADRFVFASLAETGAAVGDADLIVGFRHAQHDKIDIHAIDANSTAGGNQDFAFLAAEGAAFTAAAQVRFRHSGALTLVELNTDNNFGTVEATIALKSALTLSTADFDL